MDACDEARLRQLMLGSDSDEDELDTTPAVPAASAAPPAAEPSTASAFDFLNAPSVNAAPPAEPAGTRTARPLLNLETARDALQMDPVADAAPPSAFDFLNAPGAETAAAPIAPATPPPARNPFDSPERPTTAAAIGLEEEEEEEEDELDFTPTKADTSNDADLARALANSQEGDADLAWALQASLDGSMTLGEGPIGLRVRLARGRLHVVGVKGAAAQKGIRVNDVIETLNGETLTNVSEAAFAEKLRRRPAALTVSRGPPPKRQPKPPPKQKRVVLKPTSWCAPDAKTCALDGVRAFARPFPVGASWGRAEAIMEAVLVGRGFVRRRGWPAPSALGGDVFLADRCGGGCVLLCGCGVTDGKRSLTVGALTQAPWDSKADDAVFQALMAVRDALQAEPFEAAGLDDGFLRDLQREAAVRLERRLVAAAKPLDLKAKRAEVAAARVAVALSSAYAAANVRPPKPPRAPSLASYALDLATEPVSTFPEDGVQSLRDAGNNVTALLEARAENEFRARVGRKTLSVEARLENAARSSEAVVRALVERRQRNLPPSPLECTLTEKFRTARDDAFLYGCGAALVRDASAPRTGSLTITSDALYFSASGLAGFGAINQVLPYTAIQSVEVAAPGGSFTERLVATTASAPSALVVVDASGNSARFVVPPTPLVDAHADLVLQIVRLARALARANPVDRTRGSIDAALPQPPSGGSLRDFLSASRTAGSSSDPRSALMPPEASFL